MILSDMLKDDVILKLLKHVEKEEEHNASSYSDTLLENKVLKEFTKFAIHYDPTKKWLEI